MVYPEIGDAALPQLTVVVLSTTPSSSAAASVRILKVDPGSYVSFSALLRHWSSCISARVLSLRSMRSSSVLSCTVEKSFRS